MAISGCITEAFKQISYEQMYYSQKYFLHGTLSASMPSCSKKIRAEITITCGDQSRRLTRTFSPETRQAETEIRIVLPTKVNCRTSVTELESSDAPGSAQQQQSGNAAERGANDPRSAAFTISDPPATAMYPGIGPCVAVINHWRADQDSQVCATQPAASKQKCQDEVAAKYDAARKSCGGTTDPAVVRNDPGKIVACLAGSLPFRHVYADCYAALQEVSILGPNHDRLSALCTAQRKDATTYCAQKAFGGDAADVTRRLQQQGNEFTSLLESEKQRVADEERLREERSRASRTAAPARPVQRAPEAPQQRAASTYSVPSDLRTNCGGNGLYLVRGRSAYNVVCSPSSQSRSYCEGTGGRYVTADGDRFCVQ